MNYIFINAKNCSFYDNLVDFNKVGDCSITVKYPDYDQSFVLNIIVEELLLTDTQEQYIKGSDILTSMLDYTFDFINIFENEIGIF